MYNIMYIQTMASRFVTNKDFLSNSDDLIASLLKNVFHLLFIFATPPHQVLVWQLSNTKHNVTKPIIPGFQILVKGRGQMQQLPSWGEGGGARTIIMFMYLFTSKGYI